MKKLRLLLILLSACIFSCKKNDVTQTSKIPTIATSPVINITNIAASSGGNVTDDGGAAVTARGVCWNTSPNPTISNSKTSDGVGKGNFVSSVSGLSRATTYYLRAYATNSAGTGYGNQVAFNTANVSPSLPVLTTHTISNITSTSATGGGNIISDGGDLIIASGVCWSTGINPTIANNKTTDGTASGSFVSMLTSLTDSTIYYVRAYATNSGGTGYGDQVFFAAGIQPCDSTVTDIDGNLYHVVQIGTQCWTKENIKTSRFNDGSPIGEVEDSTAWATIYGSTSMSPAWCYYNQNSANNNVYGKLYNWYTVNDFKNVCPVGWHIPTYLEWRKLADFLGGDAGAGGPMKATALWSSPNNGATNSSGFTGLPSGARSYLGSFTPSGVNAFFWTWSDAETDRAWFHALYYNVPALIQDDGLQANGYSLRCIRD